MPSLSPTMQKGKIVKWTKNVGDKIQPGQVLCQIQTDKAVVPFQIQQKGIVAKTFDHIQQFKIGQLLAILVKDVNSIPSFKEYVETGVTTQKKQQKSTQQPKKPTDAVTPVKAKSIANTKKNISPKALRQAKLKGIQLPTEGTGPKARITFGDLNRSSPPQQTKLQTVVQTVAQQSKITHSIATQKPAQPKKPQVVSLFQLPINGIVEQPLTGMRKTIASRLVQSKTTVPHFYLQTKISFGQLLKLRKSLNQSQKQNLKASVNDFVILAVARAVRDVQGINVQWGGDKLKKFQFVDVSMAVSTGTGLITPIIHQAQRLGLKQIASKTKDLAKRARQGKLKPMQYTGGTVSISNVGMFGIDSVFPIINPPQSLIVGVGSTTKELVYDQNAKDPQKPFKVDDICSVVASVDHRVIDGAVAAIWLSKLKKYIQDPRFLLL